MPRWATVLTDLPKRPYTFSLTRANASKECTIEPGGRRERALGLPQVPVHDLIHAFGRRLRSAGVSFEDRQDLLGHKSGRITTHYSMPELENLIAAANKVCPKERHKIDTMVILKKNPRLAVVGEFGGMLENLWCRGVESNHRHKDFQTECEQT